MKSMQELLMELKQIYENYDRNLTKLIPHPEVLEPICAKERRKDITENSLTSSVGDKELSKKLYTAGEKLGRLFLSKDTLLTSLEEVAKYFHKVEQSLSQLIQIAITPTRNYLENHFEPVNKREIASQNQEEASPSCAPTNDENSDAHLAKEDGTNRKVNEEQITSGYEDIGLVQRGGMIDIQDVSNEVHVSSYDGELSENDDVIAATSMVQIIDDSKESKEEKAKILIWTEIVYLLILMSL
ncbi:hypothetical protein SUGI_0849800 [Cryptomeria japonica]|nr:hypothetical protein SUGI_0849800 [Cryptomeria japonica]